MGDAMAGLLAQLHATTDPATVQEATAVLDATSKAAGGMTMAMLQILATPKTDLGGGAGTEARLAVIQFKNLIKKGWGHAYHLDDLAASSGQAQDPGVGVQIQLPAEERAQIKASIVDVFLQLNMDQSMRGPSKQVREAIQIIAEYEFPRAWPELLPQLVAKMAEASGAAVAAADAGTVLQSAMVQLGALEVMHSLSRGYRHAIADEETVGEMRYLLDTAIMPMLEAWEATTARVLALLGGTAPAGDAAAAGQVLPILIKCLLQTARVFLSMNTLTIPEEFQDNIPRWFAGFASILQLGPTEAHLHAQYPSAAAVPGLSDALEDVMGDSDSDEAAPLQKLQTVALQSVRLYTERYEEEFAEQLPAFVTIVWQLLVNVRAQDAAEKKAAAASTAAAAGASAEAVQAAAVDAAAAVGAADESRFDTLVSAGVALLTTLATGVSHQFFADENTLTAVLANVVLPNLRLRDVDVETFESEPAAFIRADVEGSDLDTRRRAVTELVKGLRKHYEERVTAHCGAYVNELLAAYAADPAKQWVHKDVAIFLIAALAARTTTAARGATQINAGVPLDQFFADQVLPDLQKAAAAVAAGGTPESALASPVLLSASLKFVITFRSHFDKATVLAHVLPALIACLGSPSVVVHSYAAMAVERYLAVKDELVDTAATEAAQRQAMAAGATAESAAQLTPVVVRSDRYTSADMSAHFGNLVNALLTLLAAHHKTSPNEHVARALLRVLAVASDADVAPFATTLNAHLVPVMGAICERQVNPTFNHFVFEIVAILIRVSASEAGQAVAAKDAAATEAGGLLGQLQGQLVPIFQLVLENDIGDLAPYVYQLLAQLLELQPGAAGAGTDVTLDPLFASVLPMVLLPAVWDRDGSIPGLVRLVRAFLKRAGSTLVAPTAGQDDPSVTPLAGILGVLGKLVQTKLNDHNAFFIFEAVVEHLPLEYFEPFIPALFTIIFGRLSQPRMKTPKFVRSFLLFLCLFVGRHGGELVLQKIEALQPGLSTQLLTNVWLPHAGGVRGRIERKMMAVAMARLVFDSATLLSAEHAGPIAAPMVALIVQMLEHPFEPPESGEASASAGAAGSGSGGEGAARRTGGSAAFASAASAYSAAAAASALLAEESDVDGRGTDTEGAAAASGAGGFYAMTASFGGNSYARLVYAQTESADPFVALDGKTFVVQQINEAAHRTPGVVPGVLAAAGETVTPLIQSYAAASAAGATLKQPFLV